MAPLQVPQGLVLDEEIFGQLLELEADDPGFLKGLVEGYVAQAERTFAAMAAALYCFPLPCSTKYLTNIQSTKLFG
jgi:hypothetical protein